MKWMPIAKKYTGLKEIKGPKHNNIILGWLAALNAWWHDDETPWCGVFVAAVMKEAGLPFPTAYMRAKAWLSWGMRIKRPVYGCIAVFDRKGGGHVGFIVGATVDGKHYAVLGGNQMNSVNVMLLETDRAIGFRLPKGTSYASTRSVPVGTAFDLLVRSANEA